MTIPTDSPLPFRRSGSRKIRGASMASMASMAGRGGPTGSPQSYAANAGNTFRQVASELANELVAQLTQEHTREVTAMYQEVLALRSELQRVAELMQGYMQRERQLHEMMDQLTNTYQEADLQILKRTG
eukprot:s35_g6.t1